MKFFTATYICTSKYFRLKHTSFDLAIMGCALEESKGGEEEDVSLLLGEWCLVRNKDQEWERKRMQKRHKLWKIEEFEEFVNWKIVEVS